MPHPTHGDLDYALDLALQDLFAFDGPILGTTEAVVVGRLMIHFEHRLRNTGCFTDNNLSLDQEYQRAGQLSKKLHRNLLGPHRKISPDMIVHDRLHNVPGSNVLAVEVKTTRRRNEWFHDEAKLALLTGEVPGVLGYAGCMRLDLNHPAPPPPPPRANRAAQPPRVYPEQLNLPTGQDQIYPYEHGLWLCIPSVHWNDIVREWFCRHDGMQRHCAGRNCIVP